MCRRAFARDWEQFLMLGSSTRGLEDKEVKDQKMSFG